MAQSIDSTTLEVPARQLADLERMPVRCVRHGRSATIHVDLAIASAVKLPRFVPAHTYFVHAMLSLAAQRREMRVTHVRRWPLCHRCRRRRDVSRLATRLLGWIGLTLFAGFLAAALGIRIATGDYADPRLMIPSLAGLAMLLSLTVPLTTGNLQRITGTHTTADGRSVVITRPHPEFARELAAVLRR
jgi:hypothetical protein